MKKSRNCLRGLVLPLVFCFSSVLLSATDYQFKRLTADEHLSQNFVDDIIKDSKGFMWFATWGGLDRYDGYSITSYNTWNHTLKSNFCYCLAEDSHARLWVGSDSGVSCIDLNTGQSLPLIEENVRYRNVLSQAVYGIHCDKESKLWVVGDHGLACLVFDEEGEISNLYSLNMLSVQALTEDYYGRIWLATSSGQIQCLANKNPGQFDFEYLPNLLQERSFDHIRSVYADRMGNIWIATTAGLFRYNPHREILLEYKHSKEEAASLPHDFVNDVVQDNGGNIWVATLGGLALWQPARDDFRCFRSDETGLNNNFLNSLFSDDQNILWIGTEKGGVNWLFEKRNMIHSIRHDPQDPGSLYSGTVNSLLEDSKGNLWVGLVEGGLHLRAKGEELFRHFEHSDRPGSLTQNTVSKIFEDSQSAIWVGTWGGGLNRLNTSNWTFESFVPGKQKGSIASLFVSDIIEDSLHNGLWVGMHNSIQFYDKQSGQFLNLFVGMDMPYPPQRVNFLSIDHKQRLWVASNIGLYCFYLESLDIPAADLAYDYFRYSLHDASSGKLAKIISIHQSGDLLWFGSDGEGLYKMEEIALTDSLTLKNKSDWEGPGVYKTATSYLRFTQYDKRHGFADNVLYTILEDEDKNLWMGSNKGLIRFDPESLETVSFTREDGLLSNQFYWMAACKGRQGKLYFGNLQGLNYVEPQGFTSNHYMPKPSLISLYVLNHRIEPGLALQNRIYLDKHLYALDALEIPQKDKSFSLEFSSLDYEFPERSRYAYMLEGFDKQWTTVGAERRFVHYTNLKQGRYLFKLKCTNSDGQWSDNITTLPIKIRPSLYQSLVFNLCVILLVLASLIFFLVMREKKMQGYQLDLEAKLKAHTGELEKAHRKLETLNRDKLSMYTDIANEFKTPINLIIGPLKRVTGLSKDPFMREQLEMAERNTERLLTLVNQLTDFRKVEEKTHVLHKTPGNILDLAREILYPYAEAVEKRFIQCSLISKLEQENLVYDAEILRKILGNLLSNAVKYTPDYGSIKIKFFDIQNNDEPWIRMTVSNSGSGIPEDEHEKIFERFYQIKDQPGYQSTGQSETGVGLFVCRELALLHGGLMYATTNRLGGARFVLELQAEYPNYREAANAAEVPKLSSMVESEEQEAEEEILSAKTPATDLTYRGKPLILLVEDNQDMRQYLLSYLQDQYTLIEAGDGEEGWNMVLRHLPDMVISDVMMPRMNGIQLCRKIKTEFDTSHIPVILLTAFNSPQNELEGLESGANDYIAKPVEERLLKAKIKNILQLRERIHRSFADNMNPSQLDISQNSPDKHLLDKMMNIVQLRYTDPLFNVTVFIDELGISRSLLHKKLQSLVGQSAGRFIRNYRLNKAKELLSSNTDMNISEVAYSVGFNDPKYFTRCFTKRYGTSPSNYFANLHEK